MLDTVSQSRPLPYLRWFARTIVLVGALRLALTVGGAPDSIARWSSMTAVVVVGILYYGPKLATHRERRSVAYGLVIPYMLVETAALGYTWMTGTATIFHRPEYSLGTSLPVHFFGHIVGGLTWEPAMVWGLLWLVGFVDRRLIRPNPL